MTDHDHDHDADAERWLRQRRRQKAYAAWGPAIAASLYYAMLAAAVFAVTYYLFGS